MVGALAYDPRGAAALWAAGVSGLSKKAVKSPLVRSGEALVREMWQLWPDLGARDQRPAAGLLATPAGSAPQGVVR